MLEFSKSFFTYSACLYAKMKNGCSIRLVISQAGLSPVCPCLSHPGEPRTGPSTPSVALAVVFYLWEGDRITLLCLLSAPLEQPRMPLACFSAKARCWIMFNLSTRTLRSFSAKLEQAYL